MTSKPPDRALPDVLLVEDDEDHMLLTREGFSQAKVPVNLHWVENGERCMAFLRKQGEYADAPTPDLILLDLNMPVMDGREVLQALVADPALCHLPVVILTTSASEAEILKMYRLRCSSFLLKPVDFLAFERIARQFGDYWFSSAVLPPKQSDAA